VTLVLGIERVGNILFGYSKFSLSPNENSSGLEYWLIGRIRLVNSLVKPYAEHDLIYYVGRNSQSDLFDTNLD
jgi:hypothetical protein